MNHRAKTRRLGACPSSGLARTGVAPFVRAAPGSGLFHRPGDQCPGVFRQRPGQIDSLHRRRGRSAPRTLNGSRPPKNWPMRSSNGGVEPQRIGHGFLSQTRGDAGADRAGGRGRSTASDPIPRRWLAAHRRRIPVRSLPCGKPGSCAAWTPQPPESSTSAPHRRSWPRCGRSPAPGPR